MTGPPTPPATSPVELQDKARSASISTVQAQAASQQSSSESHSDIYHRALPGIIDSIQRSNYNALVNMTEQIDFTTAGDQRPLRLLVVAPLVLGHLILDDTSAARFALLRLPESLLSLSLSRSLFALVLATINREHAKVYDQASDLLRLVSLPNFPDPDLGSIINALLATFIEEFRRRTFELLSKAYTSLQLELACAYLGWPADEAVKVAEKLGWSYDASSQIFSPKLQATNGTRISKPPMGISTLHDFHLVVNSVAILEV